MSKSRPKRKSLEEAALRIFAEREKVKDLIIVHSDEARVPSTKKNIFRFHAVKEDDQNGPHYMVVLDEGEEVVDLESLSKSEGVEFFAPPEFAVDITDKVLTTVPPPPVTVAPAVNNLILKECHSLEEVITVTVPKDTTVPKVDVYFLADTTGSMDPIITAVKAGANSILTALNTAVPDIVFGVGNYKDFPHDAYAFQHQLGPTTDVVAVATEIGNWTDFGGYDYSEGQLFALDQLAEPSGGTIGWRPDSKRIIVWFGDWPGHDPVCKAISGLSYDITESSVTAKLASEDISVIAISTITGAPAGLDDDPTMDASDYSGICTIGGSSGQASRIAAATGGVHETGIDASNIVTTIIDLVKSIVSKINNLNLVPTGAIAPFVTSISPPGGYGPLPGDVSHTLTFNVRFKGVEPCGFEDKVFTGSIDVVADGAVVARKRVIITVPACSEIYSYSVKFVCGVQKDVERQCTVVRPGRYATDINIHNYNDKRVPIRKYLLPLVLKGEPVGREPQFMQARLVDEIVLPPNTATMDDCCRIAQLLYGSAPSEIPLTIGFLEVVSLEKLSIDAVYTATDLCTRTISIDVERVEGRIKRRPCKPCKPEKPKPEPEPKEPD